MNPLADLTQAPILRKIGDKTYEISPLTQADMGALCRFAAFRTYYTLRELNVSEEQQQKEFDRCLRVTVTVADDTFNTAVETPEGYTETAYLSLRHKHPEITREEIAAWNVADVQVVARVATVLSGPSDEETLKKTAAVVDELRAKKLILSSTDTKSE